MKKMVILFVSVLAVILVLCVGLTACFSRQTYTGDEFDSSSFIIPDGCILYKIPGSGSPGQLSAAFADSGQADANGNHLFTVTIGCKEGSTYMQVLSWESNFSVYAVIVSSGDSFALYSYSGIARSDTDLSAPKNSAGEYTGVEHVSILIYPGYYAAEEGDAAGTAAITTIDSSTTTTTLTSQPAGTTATSSGTKTGPATGDAFPVMLPVLSLGAMAAFICCACRRLSIKK